MALQAGIVGLPNVGKSTLFNALTSAGAESANYPFSTIEPNVGILPVPDPRLQELAGVIATERVLPAVVEIVDIAGLVRGASEGEGLGNQFLGHIRSVDAVLQVVRCFEDSDITHVDETIDPLRDIETIAIELVLADLQVAERRLDRVTRAARGDKSLMVELATTEKLVAHLANGHPARSLTLTPEETASLREMQMITMKPVLYVCNVDEDSVHGNEHVDAVRAHADQEGSGVIAISARIESDIAELDPDEREEFLAEIGLSEPGLAPLARATYSLLGLETFFTVGPKEIRAWTVTHGTRAPQAAAVIHTDFEKGFIRVEVYRIPDLVELRSEAALKAAGKLRVEGKEYVVRDGDVMHFRFNV